MDHLPALILFAAIAAVTPGPNNIMLMSSGVNFGVRASLPHLLGICFGVPMMLTAAGFGVGALFQEFPWAHELVKVLGLCYLTYLAYRIATSSAEPSQLTKPKPLSFFQAALFQWINPKTWMMGTSAIATYTSVGSDLTGQIAVVVLVFFALTWPSAGIWLLFGTVLRKMLQNPVHRKIFNYSMAALLLFSMLGVFLELIQRHLLSWCWHHPAVCQIIFG